MQPAPVAQPVLVMQQPAAGMVMQPGVIVAPVAQPVYMVQGPMDGFQMLSMQDKIYIKQKVEFMEVFTGFETANRYKVLGSNKSELFYAAEKSGCCTRMCLSAECRPFDMMVSVLPDKRPFLKFRRDFKCTWMCFNRPVLEVFDNTGPAERPIGKIVDPWNFCDLEFQVFDSTDTMVYRVNGRYCQPGLHCPMPCAPCNKVEFEIYNMKNEVVGLISKEWSGCAKEMFTTADNFSLSFPNQATPEHKALLMATIFFIDFRFFEKKDDNKHH